MVSFLTLVYPSIPGTQLSRAQPCSAVLRFRSSPIWHNEHSSYRLPAFLHLRHLPALNQDPTHLHPHSFNLAALTSSFSPNLTPPRYPADLWNMATVSRTPWQLGDSGLLVSWCLIVSLSFQTILELMADLLPPGWLLMALLL